MTTQADILQALKNADAAGDGEAAARFAQMLKPAAQPTTQEAMPADDGRIVPPGDDIYSAGVMGGYNEGRPRYATPDELKSAAGMTAATAGSLLFPPAAVPAAISKIPALGGALSFLVKNIPKAFGAGVSGAGGELAVDAAQGNEIDPTQVARTAAEYGASELGGEVVSKVAGKVLAPVANVITDQAKKLLAFAKKEKIPISAGALVPGMTEKIVQGAADNFIPSRLVNQHYRGKLITRMNELMGEIPEGVGQVLGKEESSLITTEAFRAASNTKQATAKRLREDFLDTVGRDTVVPVKNTQTLLNKISPQVKDPALREFIEVELASITKGTKTADQLEQTLNQIGAVRAKGADKKYLTQIREAAQDDFKAVGADMDKLSHSSNFFKMNSELLSNPVARKLMNSNLTSTEMTRQIFRSGNEEFVRKLSKELPKETWDSLRAQNLANQLENFSEASTTMPGKRILNRGDELFKWIENNKAVLKESYDQQTIEALENFAQLANASKGEAAKHGKDISNFGSLANLGGIGGIAYSEPVTFAASSAGMMLLAKSMMNPDGIIKQWLTTGLKGAKTTGEVAKIGGRALAGDDDGSN